MARKFEVIELDGTRGPRLKKSVALMLIRRQLAVLEQPFVIRKLRTVGKPTVQQAALSENTGQSYEHHIEPRIQDMDWTNSPWLAYLEGWA